MFGKGRWKNQILIEGEKEAQLVARIEGLPDVNPEYQCYPVDMKLPGKRSFWEAVKKSMQYSKHNVYNMFYKLNK